MCICLFIYIYHLYRYRYDTLQQCNIIQRLTYIMAIQFDAICCKSVEIGRVYLGISPSYNIIYNIYIIYGYIQGIYISLSLSIYIPILCHPKSSARASMMCGFSVVALLLRTAVKTDKSTASTVHTGCICPLYRDIVVLHSAHEGFWPKTPRERRYGTEILSMICFTFAPELQY